MVKMENWGDFLIAWVQEDKIPYIIELLHPNKIDGVGISPYAGYKSRDISFLSDIPTLKALVVPFSDQHDLTRVNELSSLQHLSLSGKNIDIDFNIFEKLLELRIEWNKKIQLPQSSVKCLKSLYIRGFKPKSRNLSTIPDYEKLTEMELNQGSITSLSGIEKLISLKKLCIHYISSLSDISSLSGLDIEHLHISNCKKIENIENLSNCKNLRELRLIDCGSLPTISFIRNIKNLDEFRFVKTRIEDGDMRPLFEIKRVCFMKKSGYSHTPDEVKKAIGDNSC